MRNWRTAHNRRKRKESMRRCSFPYAIFDEAKHITPEMIDYVKALNPVVVLRTESVEFTSR
jgi:hypothetical protein